MEYGGIILEMVSYAQLVTSQPRVVDGWVEQLRQSAQRARVARIANRLRLLATRRARLALWLFQNSRALHGIMPARAVRRLVFGALGRARMPAALVSDTVALVALGRAILALVMPCTSGPPGLTLATHNSPRAPAHPR